MELAGTDLLRKAASEWSLSGDQQLLQVLEQMHKTIVSKCHEVNNKLDVMVTTLDNASVDLQNVNNKFMALSNSQFIESRVYDDDELLTGDNYDKKAKPSAMEPESDLMRMKRALHCLEEMHDSVRILDSDSSDDEDEFRTVLKPKDVYSARRLPHVIGSSEWRDKWHVGLVVSDSDSDSSAEGSRGGPAAARDQYSDTGSERDGAGAEDGGGEGGAGGGRRAHRVSSSSEPESEPSPVAPSTVSPADVAAQIAKKLAAQRPQSLDVPARADAEPPSASDTAPRQVYRPAQPVSSTIFFDEPPPLEPEEDDSSDGDVFAELHRRESGAGRAGRADSGAQQRLNKNIVDDLFGDQEVFDNEEIKPVDADVATTLRAELESNVFRRKEPVVPSTDNQEPEKRAGKKPVGGMSLFGSSQGAESIGAAILKRSQRKSSSSEEDGNEQNENYHEQKIQTPVTNENTAANTNNIIDELFAIPKLKKKETINDRESNIKNKSKSEPQHQSNRVNTKIDLFSDNIFDDIDDIFITDIVTKPKEATQKSIFDDDDDDDELFADASVKTVTNKTKKENSLLHSDEDLFKSDNASSIHRTDNTIIGDQFLSTEIKANYERPSLEIGASENSDDSFSKKTLIFKSQDVITPTIKNDIHKINTQYIDKSITKQTPKIEDQLINSNNKGEENIETKLNISSVEAKQFESPLLFGEDEIDDLFINHSKISEPLAQEEDNIKVNIQISKHSFVEDDSLKDLEIVLDKNLVNDNMNDIKENISDVDDIGNKYETIKRESSFEAQITAPILDQVNNEYKLTKTDGTNNTRTNRENDIFDDLFIDLPPAFEKPSEPKKSKNVNALFDDDSDDESLFFKKNDVTEEKQEEEYSDDRFRIFHDEPPEIDVDFSQKSKNYTSGPKISASDEGLSNDNHSLSFDKNASKVISQPQSVNKHETSESILVNKEIKNTDSDVVNITKLLHDTNNDTNNKTKNIETLIEEDNVETEITDTELNIKKSVGKLKPINFNINVNTLIPGASPTKHKNVDEFDGQSLSYKSNEEINRYSSQRAESKMIKSVSFDGDPQSQVLDNQLSKGRARIQVKRRPSSRRARLEAVRKSGIDFADDSTDNSSSFDEPKPKPLVTSDQSTNVVINDESNIVTEAIKKSNQDIKHKRITEVENTNKVKIPNINESVIADTRTTSKTVYILHDEDIFADSPLTQTDRNKKDVTVTNDDDDEDLFKKTSNTSSKNREILQKAIVGEGNVEMNTSDTTKKQAASVISRKSIFDDLSDDDELFGGKKSAAKYEGDDELFVRSVSGSSGGVNKKTALRAAAAGPLFDDDSEEDMFRTAATSGVKQTRPKEVLTAKSSPVVRDPLSLFDDDS